MVTCVVLMKFFLLLHCAYVTVHRSPFIVRVPLMLYRCSALRAPGAAVTFVRPADSRCRSTGVYVAGGWVCSRLFRILLRR